MVVGSITLYSKNYWILHLIGQILCYMDYILVKYFITSTYLLCLYNLTVIVIWVSMVTVTLSFHLSFTNGLKFKASLKIISWIDDDFQVYAKYLHTDIVYFITCVFSYHTCKWIGWHFQNQKYKLIKTVTWETKII